MHTKPRLEMIDRQWWSGTSAVQRVLMWTPTSDAVASLGLPLCGVGSSSTRYGGAVECRQRYVSNASLNLILCGTRSQCRSRSSGLMAEKCSQAGALSMD